MHPYVICILVACWILAGAMGWALVHGANVGKPR
jgi:DNA-binding transcriptional regulator of glucitol operon